MDEQSRGLVLIDLPEVKAKIGARSDDTIYTYIKTKGFPRPVKGSRRFSRWILAEVDTWIRQRIEERDQSQKAA